jgi:hypothetical protein
LSSRRAQCRVVVCQRPRIPKHSHNIFSHSLHVVVRTNRDHAAQVNCAMRDV